MKSPDVRVVVLAGLCAVFCGSMARADPDETEVTHITDSSTDRTPAKTTFPIYPRIARRDRIEGDATVCFRIDLLGRIRNEHVRDATHRIFRRPALRAIRQSSFEPLADGARFSAELTCRTYRFRLTPVQADDKDE
ncbi:MAG: TonB family protein [Woeseia sp.]